MKQYKLKNGLTLILEERAEAATATVLLLVGVGSRNETPEIEGVAHFLEHMVFKGTKKRGTTQLISEYLDQVGGDYNAFTSKEYTGFHAHVAKEHLLKALDFVADLTSQPLLRKADFELEKGVIFEEINLYEDTPMYQVEEIFSTAIFGSDQLAHRISGSRETVKELKIEDLKDFYDKYYQTSNMAVVIVSDKKSLDGISKKVEQYFSFPNEQIPSVPTSKVEKSSPRIVSSQKAIQQGNLVVGFEGPSFSSTDRIKMSLLSALFGGMMSSRLFLRIRVKQGLCYYIRSHAESYKTCGTFAAQAGIDPKNLEKTLQAILKEFSILKEELIPEGELTKGKEYVKGKLALALEDSEELSSFYGHQWVMTGKILSPTEIIKQIEAVTSEDLQKLAKYYFTPSTLTLAIVTPSYNAEKVDRIIKSFK